MLPRMVTFAFCCLLSIGVEGVVCESGDDECQRDDMAMLAQRIIPHIAHHDKNKTKISQDLLNALEKAGQDFKRFCSVANPVGKVAGGGGGFLGKALEFFADLIDKLTGAKKTTALVVANTTLSYLEDSFFGFADIEGSPAVESKSPTDVPEFHALDEAIQVATKSIVEAVDQSKGLIALQDRDHMVKILRNRFSLENISADLRKMGQEMEKTSGLMSSVSKACETAGPKLENAFRLIAEGAKNVTDPTLAKDVGDLIAETKAIFQSIDLKNFGQALKDLPKEFTLLFGTFKEVLGKVKDGSEVAQGVKEVIEVLEELKKDFGKDVLSIP